MRSPACFANVVFALAFTLQTCTRIDPPPGTTAPPGLAAAEIAGADLDGAPLRLSDYRGSVVVLDFWGDW